MGVAKKVVDVRSCVAEWRRNGLRIAVVPTMGGLHAGHVSLVRAAQVVADRVIVTIFLNPTQFGAHEDLGMYPAERNRDLALLEAEGVDLVFMPTREDIYPPGFATRVVMDDLTDLMCGALRPGHFDGVTQVVTKLFNIVGADVAVFGEKDWQQLQIVRKLVADLNMPVEILGCPTVREPDGLALSTRNGYLSGDARDVARALYRSLSLVAEEIANGVPTELACAQAEDGLRGAGFDSVDYLECRDGETLRLAMAPFKGARVFGAAVLGETRLIDNVAVPV